MVIGYKKLLQDMFSEFGCTIVNFTNNSIMVDYFYSEIMYEKFLAGVKCRQGRGMYDVEQELEFNKIPDGKMVIVQKDGADTAKYKYSTIWKSTIVFKEVKDGKKVDASLTFRIRENKFDDLLNFIDTKGNSFDFVSMDKIKEYLKKEYREYKFTNGGSSFV